ncbi:MAG: 5'-methylthioadenosine/adenosylhomocysteine nucleosidase [Burkholderiaceae bacterium]|nr:5'-methylthioadenosine/adenosylhomocysteine nucleosidase [Burkholderiaceae bacterium]
MKRSATQPVAIVSAMHDELSKVLELMPDEHKQIRAGREFWLGHLHNQSVVVVLSGIGKVAAATTATMLIEHFGVGRILFTGVAGALGQNVKVGDMVVADSFLHHDMDASPLFPRYEIPGYGTTTLKADAKLTQELVQACKYVLAHLTGEIGEDVVKAFGLHSPQLHQGLVISGDCFVSTAIASQQLQRELPQALAVEMEGAAFAQVCHDYGIPFAAVRTMSDRADDDATLDFTRFLIEVASHYSVRVVDRWLLTLNNAP